MAMTLAPSGVSPYSYAGSVGAPTPSYSYGSYSPQPFAYQPTVQHHMHIKSHNPFKAPGHVYAGEVGQPNDLRSVMRPSNDKLDRLVQFCIEKMDFGMAQIKALSEDTHRMQQEIADAHHGGDPELRVQLVKANKEIHRLRTVLANLPGTVLDDDEDQPEEEGEVDETVEVEDPVF